MEVQKFIHPQFGEIRTMTMPDGQVGFVGKDVAAMLGNLAQCRFYAGDVVAATLRFSKRVYNDQVYQDILVTDIQKLGK